MPIEGKNCDDDGISAAADDRLSGLPEDILHHILSHLHIKEVIRTSVLSKAFMSLWLSFPVLDFDHQISHWSYGNTRIGEDKFLDHINRITQRRCQHAEAPFIQKFQLRLVGYVEETDNRINEAINFAINNGVKELNLDISDDYSLPDDIAFGRSITSLTLSCLNVNKLNEFLRCCPLLENLKLENCSGLKCFKILGCNIKYIDLKVCAESVEIHSPDLQLLNFRDTWPSCKNFSVSNSCNSLKVIKLERALVTNQWIEKLFPCLVLLEKLELNCCQELENIKICNPNLKSVELIQCKGLKVVEVRVKDLEYFMYEGPECENRKGNPNCSINIIHCKHLRQLSLHGFGIPEDFLQEQVPKLLELECLKLDFSSFKERVEIYHKTLKHLEMKNWRPPLKHTEVKIHTPRLSSFSYTGECTPFVSFHYNASLKATIVIYNHVYNLPFFKSWYELIRLMGTCKELTLGGGRKVLTFPQQLRKELVSPLVDLKHMIVEIGWSAMSVELVDSLLWLAPCLDTLVFVNYITKEGALSLKFDYMWTENRDEKNRLIAASDKLVRRYSTGNVEMEIFEGRANKKDLLDYFKDEVNSLRIVKSKSRRPS